MNKKFSFFLAVWLAGFLAMTIPVFSGFGPLKDGTYVASHDMMDISVEIIRGEILDILIIEHRGGGEKYGRMIQPLIEKILAEQSLDVDGVTGATVSSKALKSALKEILEEADAMPEE